MMTYTLHSPGDTRAMAVALLPHLTGGRAIGLCGPLGAGKTTFVVMLLELLGVADGVSSPTYVLQHEYTVSDRLRIEHWDLYRLPAPPEEIDEPPAASVLRLIEWADKFSEVRASCDMIVEFSLVPGKADEVIREVVVTVQSR